MRRGRRRVESPCRPGGIISHPPPPREKQTQLLTAFVNAPLILLTPTSLNRLSATRRHPLHRNVCASFRTSSLNVSQPISSGIFSHSAHSGTTASPSLAYSVSLLAPRRLFLLELRLLWLCEREAEGGYVGRCCSSASKRSRLSSPESSAAAEASLCLRRLRRFRSVSSQSTHFSRISLALDSWTL